MYLKCLFNKISQIPNFNINLLTDTQKDLDSENYFEKYVEDDEEAIKIANSVILESYSPLYIKRFI